MRKMIVLPKNQVRKYECNGDLLYIMVDIALLFLLSWQIFVRFINYARYSFIWPSFFNSFNQEILKIVIIITLIKILLYFDLTKKRVLLDAIFLFVVVLLHSGSVISNNFFCTLVFIAAAINMSFESIAIVYACEVGTLLFFNLTCCFFGIIPDIITVGNGGFLKELHGLGFGNHNAFMAYWLFFVLSVVYLVRKSNIRIYVVAFFIILTFLIYFLSGSNSPTIVTIGALISIGIHYLVGKNKIKNNAVFHYLIKLLIFIPAICFLGVIVGTLVYAKYGYVFLPHDMMSRFRLTYDGLVSLGINLNYRNEVFESYTNVVDYNLITGLMGKEYPGTAYFDCLYSDLLIRNGLIILLPYILVQIYLLNMTIKNKEYELFIILVFKAIYGMMENYAIYTIGCAIYELLIFSNYFSTRKKENERLIQL